MTGRRKAGFTLIEMMVALALVSLMSLAMFQAYRLSQRTLVQVTRVDGATRDVAGAQRLLRRLVEQAYPFETPVAEVATARLTGLKGAKQELFVTAPSLAAEGSTGFNRYAIALSPDESGELTVRWLQDRNGAEAVEAQGAHHEVILSGVASVSFSYLELIELGNGQFEPHWRDTWLDNALPALVRVRLKFVEGDLRKWPELMVAPRVTTDANCVFDVVSQMCRIA